MTAAKKHPALAGIGVLVIGGGIVGMCVAGFLADEGRDVAVIDDGRVGGSTANAGSLHVQMQSRFMRLYPHLVPRMEAQLHLYPKAVAFWKDFERALGAAFDLRQTGGLMVAENAEQLAFLADKARRERELGLQVEIFGRAALDRIFPGVGPAVVGAEFCADEGKLNPLLCNAAIRNWVLRRGVVLLEQEAVFSVERAGSGFDVRSERGAIRAGRVVLAAGAGTTALAAGLGIKIPAVAEPLHMNITEPAPPLLHHLVQHAERPITLKQFSNGQVVIGGGWPAVLSAGRGHPTVQLNSLIGNTALARHIVPALGQLRVIRAWAGINTSVDGAGVLGEVGAVPGLFVAIPGDAGYTLGPLSARLVADCLTGRQPGEDISPYSPDRFAG